MRLRGESIAGAARKFGTELRAPGVTLESRPQISAYSSIDSKNRSASMAAMQPAPDAVTACR